MDERFIDPIDIGELERRWAIAAESMDRHGLDVLVMQNSNDFLGGYVRWFSGGAARHGYPRTVLFFGPGDMIVIEQGGRDERRQPSPGEGPYRGVKEIRYSPSYTSIHYSAEIDAHLAADAVIERGARKVGWVNPAGAYLQLGRAFERRLSDCEFVDITDELDREKAIKSPVEQQLIRQTAALQDEVMLRLRGFIKPGLRDFEVVAFAQSQALALGSDQGIYLASSSDPSSPASLRNRHMQGRTIRAGDVFMILVESNGSSGFYTEISRIFSLGKPSEEIVHGNQVVIDLQAHTVDSLRPGTSCREIFLRHNRSLKEKGLPVERRLYCHGMGYDLVERPLIRDDEDMAIAEGMNIVVHPAFATERFAAQVCDNFLIAKDGAVPLHKFPKEIVVI